MSNSEIKAEIGIIGGTGIYDPFLLKEAREIKVHTPYGATSDLVSVGYYKNKKIAFIPRHGKHHSIPPHRVNYRANIFALKELGVQRIIGASAVGSLTENYAPGEFVLPDQFLERTKGRPDTFYEGGQVCHVSPADPFCSELRKILLETGIRLGLGIHESGTYMCIEGPRFSTRAESRLFRQWGAQVIGMTLYPECVLAKEVQLCYASVAMVTDYDVWASKPVSATEIAKTMKANVENFKKLIVEVLTNIPVEKSCSCANSLKEALV